jgi:hypothetical protein
MAKPAVPPTATDDEVRALLVRYRCPMPFHEVRTRFLGNITRREWGLQIPTKSPADSEMMSPGDPR